MITPTRPETATSPVKILLVDDQENNLIALEAALADTDYELHRAHSGREAIGLVEINQYAAIVLDFQMPTMNGYETALKIRTLALGRQAPIIFVTAIDRTDEYERLGYIAGAVDFLFKPLNIEILKAKLSIFAELFRRSEENRQQAALLKEAELREKENALLKEALQARDEFLSMAAHELRTPITPLNLQMQLFIKMYKDGSIANVPTERIVRLLQTSQTQVVRLSRLVGELVEVSRIKAERLDLKRETVELVSLAEGVLTSFTEEIKRTSCEIKFEASGPVHGEWDPFRLEQVMINLLTNALKYGPGRPVEIRIWSESGKAFFEIRDYGIGIDEADHTRIFERFERASSSQHYGGLGLGLYIACKIARLHDGDIRVESRLGEGAKFTVELPLSKPS